MGSLKKLPTKIFPGAMNQNKQELLLANRLKKGTPAKETALKGGYFNPLRYAYSDYDAADQKIANDKEKERLIGESFGRKPFKSSISKLRARYEDMLLDRPDPLIDNDPAPKKLSIEKMFRNTGKSAAGDLRPQFHPPSLISSSSGDNSRDEVGVWCKRIYKDLSETWPQLRFNVKFTLQDELLVAFKLDDDVNISQFAFTLLKYMNNMARVGLASEFKLNRRGDRWNVIENEKQPDSDLVHTFLIYAFYAPWVKTGNLQIRKAAAATERMISRTATMKVRSELAALDQLVYENSLKK